LNMIPQLITEAPGLWSQLKDDFFTDLTLNQILSLVVYARGINPASIHHASIDGQYVRPIQLNGATILTPDRNKLSSLMTDVFGANYTH